MLNHRLAIPTHIFMLLIGLNKSKSRDPEGSDGKNKKRLS